MALEQDRPKSASVASRVATQKNEVGQAALWAAIETKSDLALKLIDVPDVDNNEANELGTTPLMRTQRHQATSKPPWHRAHPCPEIPLRPLNLCWQVRSRSTMSQ